MKPIHISADTKFGKLTVIERAANAANGNVRYRCRCECGAETVSHSSSLRSGRASGCKSCSAPRTGTPTHGMAHSKVYRVWGSMIQRCTNPRHKKFGLYGGRGISVCERWMKFENFYADMGAPPEGLTLDRIDNARGYEPTNCRWATYSEQNKNRRAYPWRAKIAA